ncbi:MAG: DEAD/DEAH box helicase [Candidatus Geothermincolia bacterium]
MDPNEFEKRYPFGLDEFQRDAIRKLSRGKSVLVAAPTGSGKTVIAEYALEQALSEGKKFFYTAPLKALSNQKFRDLSRVYGADKVGLLTGDNSINGDAPLVVMTTEVLRNMIYEGSSHLDELAVVVLDEVHYMQDPARGAVWEEIVILLPHQVKLVGLSATVSNARDLASWMNSLRGSVEVVLSSERPVKLKNFYFVGKAMTPLFSDKLGRVIDDQLEALKKRPPRPSRGRGGRGGPDLRPRRTDAVRELNSREMLPAIYFLFSRAACEDSVSYCLKEHLSLNTRQEAERIDNYIREKVSPLSETDLQCLGYESFRTALKAGVAAHHAGALPLFKEAVEELFTAGLIKVVFATETLALGINMPARSVIIEALSKWNGEAHRPVTSGEYKQLTGRAGRRGIDEIGYSVVLHQKFFNVDQIKSLVTREPTPVVSRFEVSYNMAANMMAKHDLAETQRLLNLSFAQYCADARVVTLESRMESLDEDLARELAASRCPEADAVRFREVERQMAKLQRRLATISKERRSRDIRDAMARLQPGDVFMVGHKGSEKLLAVVRRQPGKKEAEGVLVVDSMGRYRRIAETTLKNPPRVIGAVDIEKITSPTRKVRKQVGVKMESLGKKSQPEAVEAGRTREEHELADDIQALKADMESNRCNTCAHRERCMQAARRVEKISRNIESARTERDSGHDVVSRKLLDVIDVLNRFGFMEGEALTDKGNLLRKIYNECDLLLVDALDEGILSRLEPRELAAFASWFIYESREPESDEIGRSGADEEHLQGALADVLDWLNSTLTILRTAEGERGLDLHGSPDTGFGEAAFMWATGAELDEMLAKFPDRSIGDMVRIMKQIIDLLRQLAEVSEDRALARNIRCAIDALDRGVVGYSSLESMIEHGVPGL